MTLKFNNTNFISIKSPILIKNIDINKIAASNKFPFDKKI